MMNFTSVPPILLGLIAAFFWGTHSSIVRFLSSDVPGITSAVIRLYIAAATIAAVLLIAGRRPRLDLRTKGLALVVLALAANFVLFHVGLDNAPATSAMLLENTAPVFVLLILAVAFRERPTLIEVVASLLVVVGAYFTVMSDIDAGGDRLIGDVLEVLAGVTWAVFIVAASRSTNAAQSTLERLNFMMTVFLASAILITPFTFFEPLPRMSSFDGLLLILLGVFPTAIAYALWYEAAARVSTVVASLLFGLTVIFTFTNAALFLGERITLDMMIGGAIIASGVVLGNFKPKKQTDANESA